MSLTLKIIGYYNHFNAGDEQYKTSIDILFKKYLPPKYKYTIDFYDCDKISNVVFSESDIIIVGGGDILNSYFIDKVYSKFNGKQNLIIALSVGIPYINMLVDNEKLNRIDYVFLRTRMDIEMFYQYIGKDRVFYLPDLSILLKGTDENKVDDKVDDKVDVIEKFDLKNKKIALFCLSRNIYNEKYLLEYYDIIYNLSRFVEYLIGSDYHIVFLPFNTKNKNGTLNNSENDILIANDVVNLINKKLLHKTTIIKETLDYKQIFYIFNNTTLCIPMRFHATLFSLYSSVPIIPIYSTRKVDNLLKEIKWKYFYKLPLNKDLVPININCHKLIDVYLLLIKSDEFLKKNYYYNINSNMFSFSNIKKLIDIILCKKRGNLENDDITPNNVDDILEDLHKTIIQFANEKGYTNYKYIKDTNLQNIIVSIVSYNLTKFSCYKKSNLNNITFDSIYNYGLKKWILNDLLHKGVDRQNIDEINIEESLFNIEYIDQMDRSGAHRSGWRYVYDNITCFNNKDNPLHLDLYIDRTFHWNKEINKIINIIPYKNPWVGFIHHTFDTSFSDYNCHKLLKCNEFIESLSCCKGIFVLSEYLRSQFIEEFKKNNINVPVYSLVHPTEQVVPHFNYKSFVNNKNKSIVHVGGWLRNVYSFYNLHIPEHIKVKSGFFTYKKDTISKIALKGKDMNNYYPTDKFIDNIKIVLHKNHKKHSKHIKHDKHDKHRKYLKMYNLLII